MCNCDTLPLCQFETVPTPPAIFPSPFLKTETLPTIEIPAFTTVSSHKFTIMADQPFMDAIKNAFVQDPLSLPASATLPPPFSPPFLHRHYRKSASPTATTAEVSFSPPLTLNCRSHRRCYLLYLSPAATICPSFTTVPTAVLPCLYCQNRRYTFLIAASVHRPFLLLLPFTLPFPPPLTYLPYPPQLPFIPPFPPPLSTSAATVTAILTADCSAGTAHITTITNTLPQLLGH